MDSKDVKQVRNLSRRGFMMAVTGSALAAAAGCRPSSIVPPTPYVPGSGTSPAPAGSGTAAASGGTAPAVGVDANYGQLTYDKVMFTSADKLYVTQWDYNNTPAVDAAQWTLTVDGLVENPMTLDYAAVKALPAFEDTRTLECISNPVGGNLIGNIVWKGFKLQDVLDKVKLKPTAKFAKFQAADGYSTSVALEWITQPGVMMAYEMNGAPLNTVHGFPLRILMPGLYGQKMPRWITHIEFIDSYFLIATSEATGRATAGPIPASSKLSRSSRHLLTDILPKQAASYIFRVSPSRASARSPKWKFRSRTGRGCLSH